LNAINRLINKNRLTLKNFAASRRMADSKYYIGSMGNLFHRSGKPVYIRPPKTETIRNCSNPQLDRRDNLVPVLRLRLGDNRNDDVELPIPEGAITEADLEEIDQLSEIFGDMAMKKDANKSSDATETAQSLPPKLPDGPWIRHPDETDEDNNMVKDDTRDDITIQESRELHKERKADIMRVSKAVRMKGLLTATINGPT
jgi:hypothetical protein